MTIRKPTFSEKKFIPYVTAVGQVALAWNAFQDSLGELFTSVIGNAWGNQEIALWNSTNFDRARREMLKAIILALPKETKLNYPALMDDVVWTLQRADELEDARNTVVHAPVETHGQYGVQSFFEDKALRDKVVAKTAMKNSRALRLIGKDLLIECRWCRDTALALRDFTHDMHYRLLFNDKPTWPGRPKLPSRGLKKGHRANQPRRRSDEAKPPRRPPPSPA